ncbi:TrlF family AAA-like ATPase [Cryobacterium sp. BB736]|uniref:TrlF family AAA-like ATPase n=1 Tax=Cryobacterium sp. BB736 TaxID=2746963 RepID=UPI001874835B
MNDDQPSTVDSPRGARWIRAALQVNPYGYIGNSSPSKNFDDENTYNGALIAELKAQQIELIAITDHWNASSASQLIADAEAADIVALPGFEANTSEGIHLLVIFERGTAIEQVTAAVGACGLTPGAVKGTTKKSYSEILTDMSALGALVIPAHANVANAGLLSRAKGDTLVEMVKHPELLAIGITPSAAPLGDQVKILKGTKPYDRPHSLVAIHADDICDPAILASPGASTWFKMSSPSLLGLRHAVKTPETRVSTVDPASTSRVLLREISWDGGYLDGQKIHLAEDLTALIGGRGTGKSTAIESLRYVLEISPIGQASGDDHKDMVKNVLGAGTVISLVVDVVTPSPARFTIERTTNSPAIVRDSSGTPTNQRPRDIVGNLEIFGQHELAELAQDKDLMAELVARVAGRPASPAERDQLLKDLADNRDAFAKHERDREALENELADIPRLTESMEAFEKTDLAAKLDQKTRLDKDEAVIAEASERVQEVENLIGSWGFETVVEQLRADLADVDDSPRKSTLQQLTPLLDLLAKALEQAVSTARSAVADAWTKIEATEQSWKAVTKPESDGVAAVLRELVEQGHKPDEYLTLQSNLNRLKKRAERRSTFDKDKRKLLGERAKLLRQLSDIDKKTATDLKEAIKASNEATTGAVIVKPIASPDRSHIKAVISNHFSIQRGQVFAAIDRQDFSVAAFVTAARSGGLEALSALGITGAQAKALVDCGEPLFKEMEEQSVGLAVEVQLNVAVKGRPAAWRRLEDLSKGQRATALLLLLLGASMSPLIIDQPEDDLDNRFVYDGVVQKLRSLKGTRQLVVSTHNANVPVLGDAELIVTLEADGQHGRTVVDGVGSLDDPTVRKYAEDLLEGGRAAFDARKRLYDF